MKTQGFAVKARFVEKPGNRGPHRLGRCPPAWNTKLNLVAALFPAKSLGGFDKDRERPVNRQQVKHDEMVAGQGPAGEAVGHDCIGKEPVQIAV